MIVVTIAAAGPIPNTRASGARYANEGRVCMRSSTGVTTAAALRLRAVSTPSGSPTSAQMATATNVTMSVSMLCCQ